MKFLYLTLIFIGLSSCHKTREISILPSSETIFPWDNPKNHDQIGDEVIYPMVKGFGHTVVTSQPPPPQYFSIS